MSRETFDRLMVKYGFKRPKPENCEHEWGCWFVDEGMPFHRKRRCENCGKIETE